MTDRTLRTPGIRRSGAAWRRLLGGAAAAGCLLAFGADATVTTAPDPQALRAQIEQAETEALAAQIEALAKDLTPLEKEWGIKLLGIRLTAADYALDLRYKVLDPEKALPLLHRTFNPNPYVIVERSGAKLGVPFTEKAGSLRSSVSSADQIKKGRNYSVLFANPAKHAKPGDEVTLVMGSFRAEHVRVE